PGDASRVEPEHPRRVSRRAERAGLCLARARTLEAASSTSVVSAPTSATTVPSRYRRWRNDSEAGVTRYRHAGRSFVTWGQGLAARWRCRNTTTRFRRLPTCRRPAHGLRRLESPGVAGGRQPAVEIEGGADERQVRERLGEVAEVLRLGAELLAVQPEVIGVAEHLLEEEARLVQVPHAGEALDVPEGAHGEGAFLAREPIGESAPEAIAIDQRVAHQLALDRPQGREPARIGGGNEANERHEQGGGVERGGADMLDERVPRRVPEVGEDVLVDGVARLVPARQRGRERPLRRESDGAVDGHPAHHPRVEELLPSTAHLPDALVRLAP